MGLIQNLLIGIAHLIFVCMDILMAMILIKVIYQRWRPECLKQINNAVEPVVKSTTGLLETWVTRITGRTYTDKTLTLIFILCLSALRFVIAGLFNNG